MMLPWWGWAIASSVVWIALGVFFALVVIGGAIGEQASRSFPDGTSSLDDPDDLSRCA